MDRCWMSWCRLCAKEETVPMDENNALSAKMITAIGKYFWVNILPDDKLPNSLCSECHDMVTGLMEFSLHVNKVQSMYYDLMTADIKYVEKSKEIRISHGIEDQELRYILRKENINNAVPVAEIDNEEFQWLDNECCQRNSEEDTLELHVELQNSFTESEDLIKEVKTLSNNKFEITCEKDTKSSSYTLSIPKHSGTEEEEDAEHEEDFNEIIGNGNTIEIEPSDDHDYEEDGDIFNDDEDHHLDCENDDDDDDEKEDGIKVRRSKRKNIIKSNNKLDFSNDYNDENVIKKAKREPNPTEAAECESRLKCKICKRKYKNPTSYRRHMLESHKTPPDIPDFKCAECGKIYPTVKQLGIHERTHLPLELKMDIPCPYCDKKMTKATVLRQHIKGQHHNNKPYICDECGKALKTMAALNEHKLVHTTECPFECEICHKRFKNKARLKTHSDVHAESTYSCHVCGMRLNTRRTLKMHMLVHSEDKQYKCNLCPQAFKRGKALKNHLILHTGMRPYKCTFCEKTFSNGSNCRAHKKKMHPVELANEEAEGVKSKSKTVVPRLDELRSSTNVVTPRSQIRGSPSQLLKLIMKGDKTKSQMKNTAKINYNDDENVNSLEHDILIDAQHVVDDNDEDNVDDDEHNGGTTMVYQIVEEV